MSRSLLVHAPGNGQPYMWDVSVLVAVSVMETRWWFAGAAQKGVPNVAPGPAPLERAITHMEVAFWARLPGSAALGLPQKGRLGFCGPSPSILTGGVR